MPDRDPGPDLPPIRSDRLAALLLLAGVGFSPPLLRVFGGPVTLGGLPLLAVYVFVLWALLIGLLAWLVERNAPPVRPPGPGTPS